MTVVDATTAFALEERLLRAAAEGLEANFTRWLRFIGAAPGEWLELQALKIPGRFVRNRFAHVDNLATALPLLQQADGFRAQGIFVVANRLDPAVATRDVPRQWHDAQKGASTSDRDVTHRRVLFIDVDAVRPSGTSATEEEMARTIPLADAVFARLSLLFGGSGALGYAHSGNGRQIMVAMDPAEESAELAAVIKAALSTLASSFTAPGAEIDRAVSDAKRLVPAFGTLKRKGAPNVANRPHRRTAFVCADDVRPIPVGTLARAMTELAQSLTTASSLAAPAPGASSRPASTTQRRTPVGRFTRANAVDVELVARALDLLDEESRVRCPGCSNTDGVALVANGLKCHHKSCIDKGAPSAAGFRTPVDLVVETRGLPPSQAADWILAAFGSQPPPARASNPQLEKKSSDAQGGNVARSDESQPAWNGQTFAMTDTGNADRFTAHHGHDVHYCADWSKWLIWDSQRWNADRRVEIELRGSQTIAAIQSEASGAEGKKRKALRVHGKNSESARALTAMLKIARSRPGIAVVPEDFDRDGSLLNCRNGILDLSTGVLRPHDRRALLTKLAPAAYVPAACCPTWERFIHDILGGNAELAAFLQRAVGYSLGGSVKEQVLFFLHGSGANGKSTFLRTLLELFGDYGLQAAPDLLLARNADAHPTAIADLFGRRLAVCQEVEGGRSFAEATVKQLTGEDVIRARRMREDFWSFAPSHKLWLAANHKPNVRGTDHAIWRRIRLIPFTVTIADDKRDPDLLEKLRAEHAGILRWAVEGYRDWSRAGLRPPKEVLEATAEYRDEQDLLLPFLEERCQLDPDASVSVADLFRAYQMWCEGNGARPLSKRSLTTELRGRQLQSFKAPRGGERRWRGIMLRGAGDDRRDGAAGEDARFFQDEL